MRLKGLTNNTYLINSIDKLQVLRIPGVGTEKFIDRDKESFVGGLISETHITSFTKYYQHGVKVSDYLDGYRVTTKEDFKPEFYPKLLSVLKKLHSIRLDDNKDFKRKSLVDQIQQYESIAMINLLTPTEKSLIIEIASELDNDEQVLCHKDLLLDNIMFNGDDIKLIDFECADFTSLYWDVANIIIEANLVDENRLAFIHQYGCLVEEKIAKTEILIDYIWGLWGWVNNCIDYGRHRIARLDKKIKLFL